MDSLPQSLIAAHFNVQPNERRRSDEWLHALPACLRSEAFAEDLSDEPWLGEAAEPVRASPRAAAWGVPSVSTLSGSILMLLRPVLRLR